MSNVVPELFGYSTVTLIIASSSEGDTSLTAGEPQFHREEGAMGKTAGCLLALLLSLPCLPAEALKTQNVVLVVSDGLRWQEVFSGADPLLMNEKNGGIWAKEAELKRAYWRATPEERRRALFPFLWGTLARQGQLFGNQTKGSIARVTNGLA